MVVNKFSWKNQFFLNSHISYIVVSPFHDWWFILASSLNRLMWLIIIIDFMTLCNLPVRIFSLQANWGQNKNKRGNKMLKIINIVM